MNTNKDDSAYTLKVGDVVEDKEIGMTSRIVNFIPSTQTTLINGMEYEGSMYLSCKCGMDTVFFSKELSEFRDTGFVSCLRCKKSYQSKDINVIEVIQRPYDLR